MRILHLLPHLSGGGAERQFSYLAPELARRGHETHAAYSADGPNRPELPGVHLHRLKSVSNYDPWLLWQVVRLIRKIKPDVMQSWTLQMCIIGGIAAKITGVPWLFREASSPFGCRQNWKTRWRTKMAPNASAIVSNSQGGDYYWAAKAPMVRRYVVPNGLPLDDIDHASVCVPANVPTGDRPLVLGVGRLVKGKRWDALLQALPDVNRKLSVCCALCGTGSERHTLERQAAALGLDNTVVFTGHLSANAVWGLMKSAAVFVSLSAYEGCPNVVQEAMACGCPLVVSDISAHREILDEQSALFVDPSDGRQAADALLEALRDREAAKDRAINAKRRTEAWSISLLAQRYLQAYETILHERSRL